MSYTLKIRVINNGHRTECILVPRARRFLVTCTGSLQIKPSGSGDENGLSEWSPICNGNRTEWSPIRSVIILVIKQI